MKGSSNVTEKGKTAGNAGSSEEAEKAGDGSRKEVEGDRRSFEGSGELFGVHLSEADKGVDTRGAMIVPDDIIGGGLHDGYS